MLHLTVFKTCLLAINIELDACGLRFHHRNVCQQPIQKDKGNLKCDKTVGAGMLGKISQAWDIGVLVGSGVM